MLVDAARADLHVHWGDLRDYVQRRVGDATLAADIAQEAYLRLARLPGNMVLLDPRAYLFTTASHLITDHARARLSRKETIGASELAEAQADPSPCARATLLSREALAVLARAVETLPPRTRQVFKLHKLEQHSYAEIAEALGISRNTVMVHMTRALAHCRDAMRAYHQSSE